jgi:hypothetical protein
MIDLMKLNIFFQFNLSHVNQISLVAYYLMILRASTEKKLISLAIIKLICPKL